MNTNVTSTDSSLAGQATPPNTVIFKGTGDEIDPALSKEQTTKEGGETPKDEEEVLNETQQEEESQDKTNPSETDVDDTTDGGGAGGDEPFRVAGVDVTSYSEEFERTGELSDTSYEALEKEGFPRELVDAYIRGVTANANEESELAQKEVESILNEVGGEEQYSKVMKWASENLTQQEQDAYDKAVSTPDPTVARLVVAGLMAKYEQENGHTPTLVTGSTPSGGASAVKGFEDRSAMIKAMNDPRYGDDPDYTRRVERRVVASGLMRGR